MLCGRLVHALYIFLWFDPALISVLFLGEAMLRLRHMDGGVSEAFLSSVLPALFAVMYKHGVRIVDYGLDRYIIL